MQILNNFHSFNDINTFNFISPNYFIASFYDNIVFYTIQDPFIIVNMTYYDQESVNKIIVSA